LLFYTDDDRTGCCGVTGLSALQGYTEWSRTMPPLPTRLGARPPIAVWSGLKWILTVGAALASVYLVMVLEHSQGGG
jgi:hypothetical protein